MKNKNKKGICKLVMSEKQFDYLAKDNFGSFSKSNAIIQGFQGLHIACLLQIDLPSQSGDLFDNRFSNYLFIFLQCVQSILTLSF